MRERADMCMNHETCAKIYSVSVTRLQSNSKHLRRKLIPLLLVIDVTLHHDVTNINIARAQPDSANQLNSYNCGSLKMPYFCQRSSCFRDLQRISSFVYSAVLIITLSVCMYVCLLPINSAPS